MTSDKEIMNAILNEHKLSASSLTNLVLEGADQNLRDDASTVLNCVFAQQKKVFDLMNTKGWYTVKQASQQDAAMTQQQLSQG